MGHRFHGYLELPKKKPLLTSFSHWCMSGITIVCSPNITSDRWLYPMIAKKYVELLKKYTTAIKSHRPNIQPRRSYMKLPCIYIYGITHVQRLYKAINTVNHIPCYSSNNPPTLRVRTVRLSARFAHAKEPSCAVVSRPGRLHCRYFG